MHIHFHEFVERFKPSFECPEGLSLPYERCFSKDEFDVMINGYFFGDDDGKWIIVPRNDTLYFYVIPLKLCFLLHLEVVGDKWQSKQLLWNSVNFKCDDHQHIIAVVSFLIDLLLLKRDAPCPFPKDLPEDVRTRALYKFALVGNATSANSQHWHQTI